MIELRILDAGVIGVYLDKQLGYGKVHGIVSDSNHDCWVQGTNLLDYCALVYRRYLSLYGDSALAQSKSDEVYWRVIVWNLRIYGMGNAIFAKSVRRLQAKHKITEAQAYIVALTLFLSRRRALAARLVTAEAVLAGLSIATLHVEMIP